MSEETSEIKVLRKKTNWTEEDRLLKAFCTLMCSAEDYIYRKAVKSEIDYDTIIQMKDETFGLIHICSRAIISDRSHTIQDIFDDYYNFLKLRGEKNPFIDEY